MIDRRAVLVLAALTLFTPQAVSSQTSASTLEGLSLLHKLQNGLGGAKQIAAIRDFEETISAQAWNAAGNALGEVRKRTRWVKSPNVIRLDQRGPRGTYVLYFDGGSGSGWEILPDVNGPDPYKTTGSAVALAGGELRFAQDYLYGFDLTLWLADQLPGYKVTSPAPHVVRIAHHDDATDFTLDPVTSLPLKSAGVSLADPNHPVPDGMTYEGWREMAGVRFPTRRVKYMSGLKRGEVTSGDIRVNVGLRPQDLATKPADFAPVLPHQ